MVLKQKRRKPIKVLVPVNLRNLFKTKTPLPLSVVVVVAAGIGMLLWMLCSGKIADDYPYSHVVQGVESFADTEEPSQRAATAFWNCEGDNISSLTDVVISVKNHYFLINGRLAKQLIAAMDYRHSTRGSVSADVNIFAPYYRLRMETSPIAYAMRCLDVLDSASMGGLSGFFGFHDQLCVVIGFGVVFHRATH